MDRNTLERFLDRYPPPANLDKEEDTSRGSDRPSPKKLAIERTIDLHGLTTDTAETQIDAFIRDAARDGISKVLIIHGKGNRPDSESVLKSLVRSFLERSPLIGATRTPTARDGGSGATWAMIRYRSR